MTGRFFLETPLSFGDPILLNGFSLPCVYDGYGRPSDIFFRVYSSNPNFSKGYYNTTPTILLNSLNDGSSTFFPFFDGLMLVRNGSSLGLKYKYCPLYDSFAIEHFKRLQDGSYHIFFNTQSISPVQLNLSLIPFSSVDEALIFIASNSFDIPSSANINIIKIVSDNPSYFDGHLYYHEFVFDYAFSSLGFLVYGYCCYPDFAPIVNVLGGTSVTYQAENLRIICQILGIDFFENSLDNCQLVNFYLEKIVEILGGTSSPLVNENLKIICQALGIDFNSNGLIDCMLSKDYVKRIGLTLGATNA